MPLPPGKQLGPYEIQASLGAGGMGEVYRALDRRLDRLVAIKVLPARAADRPEMRLRFEREARAIARLNHPHIRALYDIGEQDGVDFLVLEYLEGESLGTVLGAGPLPLEAALRYGAQLADALDKAHHEGFLHRDLKPGNVMLTKDGAKLLDFGLAGLLETTEEASGSEGPAAATTRGLTDEGTVLGTWQYMAPEQLDGKPADARTDIFAFGAVLYEMTTGRRAFQAQGLASLITAIVSSEPAAMSSFGTEIPPALERVVRKCLGKDPAERWQTARDLSDELKWIAESGGAGIAFAPGPPPRAEAAPATSSRFWIGLSGLLLVVAAILGLLLARREPPERRTARFQIDAPRGTSVQAFALSPDGRYLALAATDLGRARLWVRALDALEAQVLPGTEGAQYPFWSPDSRFIAFFAQGKMKKIAVAGGPAETLCDAADGRSGAWNRSGVIVFSPSPADVLYRVSADGGKPSPVTSFAASAGGIHRFPQFLPDGNQFLYLVSRAPNEKIGVFAASLEGAPPRRVLADESSAIYAPGTAAEEGYLFFVRQDRLTAQAFDARRALLTGDPLPVADTVSFGGNLNYGPFAVSANGVLAYRAGGRTSTQLTWFDRHGQKLGTLGEPDVVRAFALSPDEKSVVLQQVEPGRTTGDLWLYNLERRTSTRFTFDPARFPVWAPDSSRVAFSSGSEGRLDLFYKAVPSGSRDELLLRSAEDKRPTDWSRDGRFLLYTVTNPKTKYDLWILPLEGEQRPIPFLTTEFAEMHGQFSPDGRWVAYSSDESGRAEVYVQPAPGSELAGKWQISSAGGSIPRWRRDGRELYFLAPDQALMAAGVTPGSKLQASRPQPLFPTRVPRLTSSASFFYDVAADGQRFLISTRTGETGEPPITVVLNWPAQLRR